VEACHAGTKHRNVSRAIWIWAHVYMYYKVQGYLRPAAAMITNAAFTNILERILRRVSTILRYRNTRLLRSLFFRARLLIFEFEGLLTLIKLHRRSMSVISLSVAILVIANNHSAHAQCSVKTTVHGCEQRDHVSHTRSLRF
jgi:hypothetical protein